MRKFGHLLLDIEGTIVLDKKYTPVPNSVKWINSLSDNGIKLRLVTNNTTESPDDLYKILHQKGFRFNREDYFTCLTEAVIRMKKRKVKSCLVLAKSKVKKYLNDVGIKPVENHKADAVLIGYDPKLTYDRLNIAVKAISENKAILFTLHRNRKFVNEKRQIAMSAGPITMALEYACRVKAIVCGKPDRRFFLDSIRGWDVPRNEILMVSDDPFSDLVGAKKLGMSTCWVLTGSHKNPREAELIQSQWRPDFIINSVVNIPK